MNSSKVRFFLIALIVSFSSLLFSATFTSVQSGSYNNPSTWGFPGGTAAQRGVTFPDAQDDVNINFTVSITNSTHNCRNLTINSGSVLSMNASVIFSIWGSTVNNGDFTGGVNGTVYFTANSVVTGPITISGTGVISVAAQLLIRPNGSTITSTAIIAPYPGQLSFTGARSVSVINTFNLGGTFINNGQLLSKGTLSVSGNTSFVNGAGATLELWRNISLSSGSVDFSTNSNTVIYSTNLSVILNTNYRNLTINCTTNGTFGTPSATPSSKSLSFPLSVNGNLSLSSDVALTCGGNAISITGNLNHLGTLATGNIVNPGTITFNGSNQTITRGSGLGTEILGNIVVNSTNSLSLGSNLQCANLTLSSGTFDLSTSNFTCNLTGNLVTNTGATINPRNGKFRFVGTGAQTISGSGIPTFYDLIIRNSAGVTISGNSFLTNLLTDSVGNIGTSGVGTIRLVASSPTQYGRIGPVLGSLSGTGWVIDSYIDGPTTAGWQLLSSPISGNTLVDWDSDPRFYTSGVAGNNDGNACCGVFYSVYRYESSGWVTVTSISQALTAGRGFLFWVGDNVNTLTAPLIYNSTGSPNRGTIISPALIVGGANNSQTLVGNPYACPIDFTTLTANNTNVNSAGYYMYLPNGASTTGTGPISPNQGFFVHAPSGGNITFTESLKNVTAQPSITRQEMQENHLTLKVSNDFNGLGSQTTIGFKNGATDNFDFNFDLPYLPNIFESADNIWTNASSDEKILLNRFSLDAESKTVEVFLKAGTTGIHHLDFSGITSFNKYNCIWLENTENGEVVNIFKENSYKFNVSDTNDIQKFLIHFENRFDCFASNSQIKTNTLSDNTMIFNNGSGVFVKFNFEEVKNIELSVYNLQGQEVLKNQSMQVVNELLPLQLPSENQLYIVRIKSGDQILTRKIYF